VLKDCFGIVAPAFSQPGFSSHHPTNSITALKDFFNVIIIIIIIIIIMEKMEAGLDRNVYPRNRCRITNTYYKIL